MQKIIIIGSGNVATHLAYKFNEIGFAISQVYSKTLANAELLANAVSAKAICSTKDIDTTADLYIICITDSFIQHFVDSIGFEPSLIVHTAGSIPMSVLQKFKNYGVFYPLQTFSKERSIDFKTVPFCIEASNQSSKELLHNLGSQISDTVTDMDSDQRKQCHLAAVFACNFVNHLYAISGEILKERDIAFDVLKPLIFETAKKVQELSPGKAQTGPAVRNNKQVMQSHLDHLSSSELKKIYSFVSNSIVAYHKKQ